LDKVGAMLRDQPNKRIYLNSFSEGIGDGVKNYQLSVARAKALRTWLVDKLAIPAQQVVIRAYGEAFPEYPDENDLRNRHVSFEYAPSDAQDNVF
jgi:outer membrane protein OmpA-like peptidoglycan-associated protein